MCFECPTLVEHLRTSKREGAAKSHLVGDVEIDYRTGTLKTDGREFSFPALSPVAQELVVAGGAEEVVKRRLAAMTRG